MIAACSAFASGAAPAPDVRLVTLTIRTAKRAADGARLAGAVLCAGAVTAPEDVITLIGAVADDYARSELFSDAIKMRLLGPADALAAAEVMERGSCWRRNVLCAFLRLEGASDVLSWTDVHGALPEVGSLPELNYTVICAIEHGILKCWETAWALSACAGAMGQRDVALAAIGRGIAPAWDRLHPALDRLSAGASDGEPSGFGYGAPDAEEQRGIVVRTALEAGELHEAGDVRVEIERALAHADTTGRWHTVTLLAATARRLGHAIPEHVRAGIRSAGERARLAAAAGTPTVDHRNHRPSTPSPRPRRNTSSPGQLALFE